MSVDLVEPIDTPWGWLDVSVDLVEPIDSLWGWLDVSVDLVEPIDLPVGAGRLDVSIGLAEPLDLTGMIGCVNRSDRTIRSHRDG